MSALLGEVGGFLDKYLIAYALGAASQPALAPFAQSLANDAWKLNAVRPPDAFTLAQGVAQGQVAKKDAYEWAKEQGFGAGQMDALVSIANVGPALGYAFEAWRRGFLTDTEFETALRRTGLEPQWYPAMKELKVRLLDLPTLANAIQRGVVKAPFQLPYTPDPGSGRIPSFPVSDLDATKAAAGLGYTVDDLFLETALAGNPPGPEALYRARFRGAIEDNDVLRGLVEGRARAEWAPAFEADARAIPSPANFVEGNVRDWITKDEMVAGAARHGMTPEDVDLLFKIHGRPLTHSQVFIGLLRGGTYDGPIDMIDPAFLKSLRESDMRPEWYNLAWHSRFHFPPFFQTINALNKGWINAETATNWLLWQAYDPDAVGTIIGNVAGAKGGTVASPVRSAQTALLRRIRAGFVSGKLTEVQVTDALGKSNLTLAEQSEVLAYWAQEKAVAALEAANVAAASTATLTQ